MARFKFQLQSFLNLKEKLEEQKKLEYGRALAQLEAEKQIMLKLLGERDENIASFKRSVIEKISPAEIQRYNNYIEILKKRIIQQEEVILKAEKFVESKRLQLVDAVKDRKMLDTLREKARDVFLKEEALSEQKGVDEIVSYRYNTLGEK